MNKHHNHTSFKTFAQNVLGFSDEADFELENIKGELNYSYSVNKVDEKIELSSVLSSKKGNVERSCIIKGDDEKLVSLVPALLNKNVVQLDHAVNVLQSAQNHSEINSALFDATETLRKNYGLAVYYAETLAKSALTADLITFSLPQLTELAIVLGKEKELARLIADELQSLLTDMDFLKSVENLRLIQQILAASSEVSYINEQLLALSYPVDESSFDAMLSIFLSVSKNVDDFKAFTGRAEWQERLQSQQVFSRTIETLSRSPVKINFITDPKRFTPIWRCFDETIHVRMLFRACYFIADTDQELLNSIDTVKLLITAFSMDDADFNVVYRDIRRSYRTICSRQQLEHILEQVDVDELSLNKWIYLFSLLQPHVEENEKLGFFTQVMLMNGIPVVSSEVPLTFAAALGLKKLSNEIINDSLLASNCTPCLPIDVDYSLKDIFSSVIEAGQTMTRSGTDKGLVSIIITTFNPDLDFFKLSLHSLALQSYQNIEVIIVDDCSEQTTSQKIAEICDSFENMQITFIRNQQNVGQYVSRNIAIQQSKGQFIAIQDDDDVSHPQRIERQVNALESESYSACFTKHVRYSDEGMLSVDDPRNLLVLGDGPASLIFKRDVLNTVGGFRAFRSRGDIDFRTRIQRMLGEQAIYHLNIPLYYMRSSLKTISSLYEYLHGDQLVYFRKRIAILSGRKASQEECGVE
ncbi:glycosyltransferase family 2 protein [Alteromonas ponticola]|uniref:Glycosyltransferase family 2 protein n=1 Tax=Alteromonas ponticola TaxID=2720613 RepID=A0ABX1R4N3_9ALTE|nr:glycosyltransferase family 2 protein [Alteromonas ponticola]NMH60190.1 glycosyltransferase family 2 protein [Alteromonas ponticola]